VKETPGGKPIMVSFQVKREDWPDLHRWLSSIIRPGERSLRIREALQDVALTASGRRLTGSRQLITTTSDDVVESSADSHPSQQNVEIVHDPAADEGAIAGMMDMFQQAPPKSGSD
jgi:hypothetical protein